MPLKKTVPPQTRTSGVFLHVTSLPSRFGIGDLGRAARAWIDRLSQAKQTWWQFLPLNPAGAGNSPYHALSAFAGDPNLISPEDLAADGLLHLEDLEAETFPDDRVDFARVTQFKNRLWLLAAQRFFAASSPIRAQFDQFVAENLNWLGDFALFMAIKESRGTEAWHKWEPGLELRDPGALDRARHLLAAEIRRHELIQFLFFRQLRALKQYANKHWVKLLGDLPIFVSDNSADVWANPDLFLLDEDRRPKFVAGVPPDYFSKTGQRWGSPHYNWPAMERDDFAWWRARIGQLLGYVDRVRIDHFRGFSAAWQIAASSPTAEKGRWVKAPGLKLFRGVQRDIGALPFIAEDLGLITPGVRRLRGRLGLPGMRVLQFGFNGDPANQFLQHNFVTNCAAYTSTHDTDTAAGWYAALGKEDGDFFRRYTNTDAKEAAWTLIRLAWSSVADTAMTTLQDVLGLGSESRLNTPGIARGNWAWRVRTADLAQERFDRLRELTDVFGRAPKAAEENEPSHG
ncbi:MAG TPA: 4-alpha-glucanotransferase [Humisphaera sp.]|jgi:4-alpha-glucanotransferase|nr:4-alpha-glucanotransferase [Humisphaera sp.]